MTEIVYLNQNYVELQKAKISVMDRGFLLADGVYEVIPVYGSTIFLPEEHYSRLLQNLAKVSIDPGLSYSDFIDIINGLLKQNAAKLQQSVYFQITRGVGWSRKQFEVGLIPTVFAKLESFTPAGINGVVKAITVNDWRWGHCEIKGINRLANVLMASAAYQANVDEAIIIHNDYVIEGASSNIFIVENNTVITPPLSNRLLNGITRKAVIDLIKNKYSLIEDNIPIERLFLADEVLLTSSTREIVAVAEIDGKKIANGQVGPVTATIQFCYRQYINSLIDIYCKPEQK